MFAKYNYDEFPYVKVKFSNTVPSTKFYNSF